MLRFVCLISCFVLFSCHYNQKNPINEEEEQCFFAPPDASLDSIRQSLKAKENYLKDYFTSLSRSGVFNGNILVAENGQILYSGSFGYADRKTNTPLNLNTRFQLASV
jgi:CubicO group peptidase (beta-lactamase class C family)